VGLSLIVGNACVAPLSRVVRTRTGLLMLSTGAQAVLAVACGLLTNFFAVVSLYLLYGVAVGLAMPVKQAYLNAHIPSAQRATIATILPQVARLVPRRGGIAVFQVLPYLAAVLADVLGVMADVLAVAAQLTAVVADFLAVVLHLVRVLGREHHRCAECQHYEE